MTLYETLDKLPEERVSGYKSSDAFLMDWRQHIFPRTELAETLTAVAHPSRIRPNLSKQSETILSNYNKALTENCSEDHPE